MSSHAPFAPSSATRWLKCQGSFALGLQLPEPPEGPYATEGTRLHDVAAAYLRRHATPRPEVGDQEFLKPYLDHCEALKPRCNRYEIELRQEFSQLLFGTPDFVAIGPDWLEIVDLKTGAGIMVEPEENDQLLCYAFMVLNQRKSWQPKVVRLTIVQPTDEDRPVKTWNTSVKHVMAWGARAQAAMQAAIEGSVQLEPGDHCRFCKAKPVCPKLAGHVVEALPVVVRELRPDRLGYWLEKADLMQQWLDSLREVAHDLACSGHPIPGWELKPKRAVRSWADEEKVAEIARSKRLKIFQPRKLMSPAMAEKAHPNLPEELTSQIVAVSSGANLVKSKGKPQALPVAMESEANPEQAKLKNVMGNLALLKYRR